MVALKNIDERPLDPSEIQPALALLAELERAAAAFKGQVQGDNEKDGDLASVSVLRVLLALQDLQKVQKQYRYGTDLYRTHLNMLQVRTAGSMVLAIPTYRDPDIRQEEESATGRIKAAFSQLYGRVDVVAAPSDAFIKELGSVHCLTKVVPEGIEFMKSDWNRANMGTAAHRAPK
jgi:agmatine/peptidylarginine deiminase